MALYKILKSVPEEDYDKIIDFLKSCWNVNHALVKSKELMDFQHFCKKTKSYNFIVAENQVTGRYDALTGYIPTCQFDPNLELNGDYWGAIWKRRDDIDNDEGKQLGLDVWEAQFSLPNFKSHGGISLSGDAIRWYKALRWKLYYMHQYFIINKDSSDFKIAKGSIEHYVDDPSTSKESDWDLEWISLDNITEQDITPVYRPFKSIEFLRNRYRNHPIYHYNFLGLFHKKEIQTVLVTRTVEVNGSRVLRIVDVVGELGGYIYNSMQKILKLGGFEYVDLLNMGIDNTIFAEMGFLELDFDRNDLILPNYFEPFEQHNVKMTAIYKAKFPYVMFKGDADQDRPNIL